MGKVLKIMQTYEGFIENGQFYPIGMPAHITGRHRVIMTVIDEPGKIQKTSEMSHLEYLSALDELCGSIDDPTFLEPPEIPWIYNAPREEVI